MQRILTALLSFLLQETRAADVEGTDDCGDSEVCLLQSTAFMERIRSLHGHGVQACPGGSKTHSAQRDKCSFEGVSETLTSLFDDNVEMKDFHWYVNGDKDTYIDLETHAFQVGDTVVTLEGRDLAGNMQSCRFDVKVVDEQKPKWLVSAGTVDSEGLSLAVDGECARAAPAAFHAYEELGWKPEGTDNCGVAGVQKEVLKGGKVLYDDSAESDSATLSGPGSYELSYTLTDVHGLIARHTVMLKLADEEPPKAIECPEDIFVEIEATETEAAVAWALPKVTADNCLGFGALPEPVEANGLGGPHPTDPAKRKATFPVGAHPIKYAVADAFGNFYHEECVFTVEVVQKAHPVKVTCPADCTAHTLESAGFGVCCWEPPTATQGPNALAPSHISFPAGVYPGLPFPYGTTTVTVRAVGAITGTRTEEEDQTDECTFTVTIRDPYRPVVDGRKYRCGAESGAPGVVEPYGVCGGDDLRVILHEGYEDTGGYDVEGVVPKSGSCCADEHGAAYSCQQTPASRYFSYCQPTGSQPATGAEGCDAGPWGPQSPDEDDFQPASDPIDELPPAPDPTVGSTMISLLAHEPLPPDFEDILAEALAKALGLESSQLEVLDSTKVSLMQRRAGRAKGVQVRIRVPAAVARRVLEVLSNPLGDLQDPALQDLEICEGDCRRAPPKCVAGECRNPISGACHGTDGKAHRFAADRVHCELTPEEVPLESPDA